MKRHVNLLKAVLASTCFMMPHLAQAVFTINAVVNNPTQTTDQDGDPEVVTNTITDTGTINESGAPGVDVLNKNNIIEITASEADMPAIAHTQAGTQAINIQAAGTTTTINVGTNRSIITTGAASDGILSAADLTTINNDGRIGSATGVAINTTAAGTNLTINNTSNGGIVSTSSNAINVIAAGGATGFTLNNSASSDDASKGIGSAGTVPTINLANTKVNTITNSGDIGNLNNAPGSNAFSINNVSGVSFTNSGDIENESAAATIDFNGAGSTFTGGLNNSGDIVNKGAGPAILFNVPSAVTLNQNAGLIDGAVSLNFAGAGTVFNIRGGTIDGVVTDASTGVVVNNISGGTIKGAVNIGTGNGVHTVNISDGSITGKVSIQSNNVLPSTLNISGGTLADVELISSTHTLNFSGGSVQNITGDNLNNQTINYSGGNFASMDGGTSVGDVLNVSGIFLQNTGPINDMDTINTKATLFDVVNPITNIRADLKSEAGVLNIKANVSGAGTLTNDSITKVFAGSTAVMGGALTNNGLLQIEPAGPPAASPIQVNGVTNNAGGTIFVGVQPSKSCPSPGDGTCGAINAGGGAVTLNAGSFIVGDPVGEFIPNGAVFDVISNTGAQVDNGVIVSGNSATVNFTGAFNGGNNSYEITAQTIPFSNLPTSEITVGLANALDTMIAGLPGTPIPPQLVDLLGQLQNITTVDGVEASLRTLVPNFNHSISTMSSFSIRRAFDDIGIRLEELLALSPLLEEVDETHERENLDGWNFGDPLKRHKQGVWVKPYASIVDQQKRQSVDGYRGDVTGITIGGDWRILSWATLGAAVSFAKSDITQRGPIDSKQDIDSLQLTFYGQFDPYGPLYLNTLVGMARHKYDVERTISVGNLVQKPTGSYHGLQWAGKLEAGYAYFNGKYYLNPVAKLTYMRLAPENYSETGVPLGLTIRNQDVQEFIGSIGLKLAMQNEYLEATYIPEVTGMVNYDFANDAQVTFNNFIVGGPTFTSVGITPDRTFYTLNAGLRIHTYNNHMFKIAYEFEARNHFLAHSAMFKWYYKWY